MVVTAFELEAMPSEWVTLGARGTSFSKERLFGKEITSEVVERQPCGSEMRPYAQVKPCGWERRPCGWVMTSGMEKSCETESFALGSSSGAARTDFPSFELNASGSDWRAPVASFQCVLSCCSSAESRLVPSCAQSGSDLDSFLPAQPCGLAMTPAPASCCFPPGSCWTWPFCSCARLLPNCHSHWGPACKAWPAGSPSAALVPPGSCCSPEGSPGRPRGPQREPPCPRSTCASSPCWSRGGAYACACDACASCASYPLPCLLSDQWPHPAPRSHRRSLHPACCPS